MKKIRTFIELFSPELAFCINLSSMGCWESLFKRHILKEVVHFKNQLKMHVLELAQWVETKENEYTANPTKQSKNE